MQPNAKGVWGLVLAMQTLWAFFAHAQIEPRPLKLFFTNSEAVIEWTGQLNDRLRIDASDALLEWEPLMTVRSANGTNKAIDAGAPYWMKRFYRAEQLNDANAFLGDHLVTTNGIVTIQPIYHATFVMKWGDKYIYNDPASPASISTMPKADLILISHSHGDHYSSAWVQSIWKSNTVIIAPQAVYTGLTAGLRATTIVLGNGMKTNAIGLEVEAVPAYNANHPRGQGNGYVVTIGGKRLYMAGDTGDTPEMKALQDIDAAFLPMNVPFTMNITNAAAAVREFKPGVVYPYHFRNQDGSYARTNTFKELVGKDLGIEVRLRKWY